MIEALTFICILILVISALIYFIMGGPEYRIVKITNGYGRFYYRVEQKVFRYFYGFIVIKGTLEECKEYILRESVKTEVVK